MLFFIITSLHTLDCFYSLTNCWTDSSQFFGFQVKISGWRNCLQISLSSESHTRDPDGEATYFWLPPLCITPLCPDLGVI